MRGNLSGGDPCPHPSSSKRSKQGSQVVCVLTKVAFGYHRVCETL